MTLDPTCCAFIRLSQLSRRRRCCLGGNRFSVCCSSKYRGSIVQPAGTVHCHAGLLLYSVSRKRVQNVFL